MSQCSLLEHNEATLLFLTATHVLYFCTRRTCPKDGFFETGTGKRGDWTETKRELTKDRRIPARTELAQRVTFENRDGYTKCDLWSPNLLLQWFTTISDSTLEAVSAHISEKSLLPRAPSAVCRVRAQTFAKKWLLQCWGVNLPGTFREGHDSISRKSNVSGWTFWEADHVTAWTSFISSCRGLYSQTFSSSG